MKLAFVSAALATAIAGSAASAQVLSHTAFDAGMYTFNRANGTITPGSLALDRATVLAYADWSAPQGSGALNGGLTTGLNRIDGDRVSLVPNGVNLLSDLGFSFYNLNATGSTSRITSFTAEFNFFDGNTLAFVDGFNAGTFSLAGLGGGGLAAQSSIRFNFGAAALEPLDIQLPNDVVITMTVTAVTFSAGTGTDPNLIGQQVRNPVSVGTSTDELVLNGSIVADPFGTGPDGNFSYFVVTNSIPTPASAALLGLGGLVAVRRRR